MAANIHPDRQKLMEQVLEYWYTVDFLNQGSLQTEQNRRDKENYAFVMSHPFQFGSLYRHTDLQEGENILGQIRQIERRIADKQNELEKLKGKEPSESQCCHGRITVYVGSINRAYLSLRIAKLLECEPPSNPSADRMALASFQLTEDGKYLKGSMSISPILWAVQRIIGREKNQTMYEVLDPEAYRASQESFELIEKQEMTGWEDIQNFAKKLMEDMVAAIHADQDDEAGVLPEVHYCYSIYRKPDERTKRETEEYYGLSMSFYAEDLAGFKKALGEGKWSSNPMWRALREYICAPYDLAHGVKQPRKDLSVSALRDSATREQTIAELRRVLAVDQTPLGKWPSRYQPFFMQQVAINLAINTDQPIFAVNGPPGTGKTTLLREIVAENVVRRAMILAKCNRPDDLFSSEEIQIGSTKHVYFTFKPEVKDIRKYGIVVASSNNAAVENISKQLPLADGVERNTRGTGNAGIEAVHELFSMDRAKVETVLRTNYDKEGWPKEPVELRDIYFSSYASDMIREPCWGLISAPLGKRSNIVTFYKKVLKQLYWDFFHNAGDYCRIRLPRYQKARERFIDQLNVVLRLRADLAERVADAERRHLAEAGSGEDRFICLSEEFLDRLSSLNPEERRKAQMTNPRLSARYDREREKLFHAALLMTKEFVLASTSCQNNFDLLGKVWGVETYKNKNIFDRASTEDKEAAFKKCMAPLIQTLQLLVPVISTTFASAGRFFRYVNKLDALGTIIVDEAGQATPQMALRLFSKASRAIVVGDPNQISPVVSDELAFLESTLDQGIGEAYSDKTISVQKIADYLCPYGGTQMNLLRIGESQWIGIPLYVHSRCIEPMFSISNNLSYDGAMLRITGEPSAEEISSFCYPLSQWINVSGEEEKKKNHFVRTQGERVLQILETAFAENMKKPDVERAAGPDLFIISPFHTVAEGMRQMLTTALGGQYPVLAANREIVENWIIDEQNPHIGTVHTFQGREAKEVILLLGCDEHSIRSANWVNRNIVNVAVSRARYRLYVIGDIKVWSQCEPVMEMKYGLDSYAFDRLAAFAEAESTTDGTESGEIPLLPSAEMFEIEPVPDPVSGEEYAIGTDSAIKHLQAFVPGYGMDFQEQDLERFGLRSMEEFETLFSEDVQNLLRTGMWNYIWLRPYAEQLPEHYDLSSVAVCFCKAFEVMLRENYLKGLQKLVPEAQVKGRNLSEMDGQVFMIGDYCSVLSYYQNELGRQMVIRGYTEMDEDWWANLLGKLRRCKENRNKCCHPGETYTWQQLEELLDLLFKDSRILPLKPDGNERVLKGLMLDQTFRNAARESFNKVKHVESPRVIPAHRPGPTEIVREYCQVISKNRVCPVDKNPLIHKAFSVRKKDGQVKKMNMQYCKKCGRKFMDAQSLSGTIRIEEYELTAVPIN